MTRRAPSGSCYILGPYSSHTNCRQNIMDEKWGLNGFDMTSSALEIVFQSWGPFSIYQHRQFSPILLKEGLGAEYLVFVSSCSLKTREKYTYFVSVI